MLCYKYQQLTIGDLFIGLCTLIGSVSFIIVFWLLIVLIADPKILSRKPIKYPKAK